MCCDSTIETLTITDPDSFTPLLVGLLVVNVQWRGKTYVGTLCDSSKQNTINQNRLVTLPPSGTNIWVICGEPTQYLKQ